MLQPDNRVAAKTPFGESVSTTLYAMVAQMGNPPTPRKFPLVRHDDNNVFPCIRVSLPHSDALCPGLLWDAERARKETQPAIRNCGQPAHCILGVLGAVLGPPSAGAAAFEPPCSARQEAGWIAIASAAASSIAVFF